MNETLLTPKEAEEKEDRGKQQAAAQFSSIKEMIEDLEKAQELNNPNDYDEALQVIYEDPLSVQVGIEGFFTPGDTPEPDSFEILLCTGGPACRIIGDIGLHGHPEKPRLQYQDWFTPWTDYYLDSKDTEILERYCQQFTLVTSLTR